MLMTPSLLQNLFGLAQHDVMLANLAGTAALCLSTVFVGAATDRFGVRRVSIPVLLMLIAATYGLYLGAEWLPSAVLPLYVLAGIGAGGAVLVPLTMVRAFPPAVRLTGVSFSYNISYAVFGGVTPLLVAWLAHLNRFSPAHYIGAVTMLGLLAILTTRTTGRLDKV